jgi:predicted nucleic-acid-binding protein
MRAVDTNVLVRLVTRDGTQQVAAAKRFVARGAWVPQIVLVEAVWVLDSVYDLGSAEIAIAVEMLLNHKDLTVQDSDAIASALVSYRKKPSVNFHRLPRSMRRAPNNRNKGRTRTDGVSA